MPAFAILGAAPAFSVEPVIPASQPDARAMDVRLRRQVAYEPTGIPIGGFRLFPQLIEQA